MKKGNARNKAHKSTKYYNYDKDIRYLEKSLADIERIKASSEDAFITLRTNKLEIIDKIHVIKLNSLIIRFTNMDITSIDDIRISQLRNQFLSIIFEWLFKRFKDVPTPHSNRSTSLANAIIQTTRSIIDKQMIVDKVQLKHIMHRFLMNLFNAYTVDGIEEADVELILRYI
jgi:hypothetical protein